MRKIAVFILVLTFTLTAFADQAAYITKDEAERAVALLKGKTQIKHYCEPCDDKSITTQEIETIEAVPAGYEDFWEVKVNGEGIDLAYVYYNEKKEKWKNVAMQLKIDVSDVPKYLPKEDK